jgi:hypothetical protein
MSDFTTESTENQEPLAIPDWQEIDITELPSMDAVLPAERLDITDGHIREIGFPQQAAQYWHLQDLSNECSLYAQGCILESTGQELDISRYRQQGVDAG